MTLDYPHRRFNQLTREWVLVSPHRAKRPWLGQEEKTPPENLPAYDPTCYLCPGNSRAGGVQNPRYTSTFVFDNDFAALLPDIQAEAHAVQNDSLFVAEPEPGRCRVVCFSPRHDLTLPELSQAEVEEVIRTWTEQTRDLGSRDFIPLRAGIGVLTVLSMPESADKLVSLTDALMYDAKSTGKNAIQHSIYQ